MSSTAVQTEDSEASNSTTVQFAIQQQHLKAFVSNARTLVDEARIRVTEEGLTLRAVDPANVGMIDERLLKEAFKSYHPGNGEAILGVDLERVADVLGMGGATDIVSVELDAKTRKLHFNVDGLEYTLALIDPDSIRPEPDLPDLDLPAIFDVPGSEIIRAVKAADMVADHIRFRYDEDAGEAVIEADGDTDSVEVVVNPDRGLEVIESGEADSLFSVDYAKDISKAFTSSSTVCVELGGEFPVKFHFEYADGLGSVTNLLAPRVSSS